MLMARDLVVTALTADVANDLDLDLSTHGITERFASGLVLADRPCLQVDIHHLRLISKVIEVHPLKRNVVDRTSGRLHQETHVVKALVCLGILADDGLGRV